MRKILAIIVLFSATILASCEAGPGCFERDTRTGDALIECR